MALILFISACVPPTTSETRNAETGGKNEKTVATVTTNKSADLYTEEMAASGDYLSRPDEDYREAPTSGVPLEDKDIQDENTPVTETVNGKATENVEPQKYNKAVTVVANIEAPVNIRRGTEVVKEQNLFYDKSNDAYDLLQKANESLAGFPVNRVGEVDWVEALNQNLINPRSSLSGNEEKPVKENDIIMKNTKEMPYVLFSHQVHSQWLDCNNCHDKIFLPKINTSQINMNKIFGGEYCGVCHNKVAFTTYVCEMCHSVKNTPE